MRIGVIADTHGYLDPAVSNIFEGVDLILHAGDIGDIAVVRGLEALAPIRAIRGNHEPPDVVERFSRQEVLEIQERKVMLAHGFISTSLESARMIFPEFFDRIRDEEIDLFVFGHTHMPYSRKMDSTLYFNPGYAGPERDIRPAHVGLLEIDDADIRAWHVAL